MACRVAARVAALARPVGARLMSYDGTRSHLKVGKDTKVICQGMTGKQVSWTVNCLFVSLFVRLFISLSFI